MERPQGAGVVTRDPSLLMETEDWSRPRQRVPSALEQQPDCEIKSDITRYGRDHGSWEQQASARQFGVRVALE
ncbi:hypothetical protein CSOJ01_12465 [Colletotrichum sojae]|uniref:Uncharacterized protein n=1 Tax=Colletotrichum sojae TaxID=2175907 RepID=A0A8H6IV73_9PEZI|nr:hypothetical protein CSOJ01_12465 [Colletotrichum sojae]